MTVPNVRFHGLDTLRAAAILAVVFYHLTIFGELPRHWLPFTGYGWMGVDLFFVLSGFLIGQQLLRPYAEGRKPSLKGFYGRRAWRVLPAYLAVLMLYCAVPAWREAARLAPIWKFFTFTMNFGFSFDRRAFSHAWSLCVEEHFYLALPLLIALLMRRPSARKTIFAVTSFILGGIALRWWLIYHFPGEIWTRVYYPTYTRLDGLTAGVMLAFAKTFRPALWSKLLGNGHLLTGAGLACVAAVMWLFRHQDLGNPEGPARWGMILGLPLLAFGWALLTASAVSPRGVLARWRIPGSQAVASLAFSLYLTHKEVAHFLHHRLPALTEPSSPATWGLYAAACPAVAAILYLAVERPCLQLRDQRTKDRVDTRTQVHTNPAL